MHWTPGFEVWVRDQARSVSCVLGRDTFSHRASLHPGVLMGTGELSGRPHKMLGGGPCDGLASHGGGE